MMHQGQNRHLHIGGQTPTSGNQHDQHFPDRRMRRMIWRLRDRIGSPQRISHFFRLSALYFFKGFPIKNPA